VTSTQPQYRYKKVESKGSHRAMTPGTWRWTTGSVWRIFFQILLL